MKPNFAARSIRWGLPLFVSSSLALAVGCSAGSDGTSGGSGASNGTGSGSTGSGTGSTGSGTGGGIDFGSGGSGQNGTGGDRPSECTVDPVTGTKSCVCISVATWGALGTYGANPGNDGSDAISDWLNQNSTGDAAYFASKPVITAESLAGLDILILQDLRGWTFTLEEKAAVEAWVRGGGGIIALQGYSDVANEASFTNDLVAFSGLSYVGNVDDGDTSDSAEAQCGYCLGNSDKQEGFVATHPISKNVTAVGAFKGRSIGGDGDVVAEEGGKVFGMTKQVDAGRVFLFHDEWVTYNSQWNGTGLKDTCMYNDPNNACNNVSPLTSFQIPQFWYNSLKYVSGDPACFTIADPVIVK